ncbi:MAG: hypothetical protein NTX10_02465 [Actinobacteria bacterium]|nr:hypothetical protein [Actinomycetota bacterium]
MSEASNLKLNLITAISNSEKEDNIAELLFSQGCNIIYRALNLESLERFLDKNQPQSNIVYSKDFLNEKDLLYFSIKFKAHRFIETSTLSDDRLNLLTELSQVSKPPLIHKLSRRSNLTTVIGSPGSPGISTVTNHLALSIDAKVIAGVHHNIRPKSGCVVIKIAAPDLIESISKTSEKNLLIDGGSAISLTSTLSDRRLNARWLFESINSSYNLIYIINADENGIFYLSRFVEDFANLINPPKIIYILNNAKFDRYGRMIQKKFIELVKNFLNIQIPYDPKVQVAGIYSLRKQYFWQSTSFSKQIDKIGNHLI